MSAWHPRFSAQLKANYSLTDWCEIWCISEDNLSDREFAEIFLIFNPCCRTKPVV